ncbi:MAG: hypothetical protein HXY34_08555, partial [Candidatus Thorarchaeota archaeon]|nr:hypothetical protein [Candidatus Thorarchaeota archaeon]
YQITGPSYQVKYHHPDRDYYQIATWNDWSRNGYECSHNQIEEEKSSYLAIAGWAVFFGAIGAYLTAGAGGLAAAGAALVAAVLGLVFGYVTQAVLLDEAGCIWWWWGNDYQNWLMTNLWWLVLWFQVGVGAAALAFKSIGYYRAGSYTFWDGQGLGDP